MNFHRSVGLETETRTPNLRFGFEWLLFGLVALILGGYIGQVLFTDYRRIDAEERDRLSTQANVVVQNLVQQLAAVERSLASMRDEVPMLQAKGISNSSVNRRLKTMSDALPGVRTIVITDAEGKAIASNREQVVGQSFSDREIFKITRQGNDPAKLYVSPPYKTGFGVYAVTAAKAFVDDRGAFAGGVSATLDPEYFSTLLNSIRYSPDMLSTLIHADGNIIFRVPDPQGIVGINLARPGSFFTQHMKSGQDASTFAGAVASTGENRLTVFRTIRPAKLSMDKPLVLVVSREMSVLFAHWREEAFKQCALFTVLLLSSVLSLYLYQNRKRDRARMAAEREEERKQAEDQLRITATVFESREGMVITDANEVILRVNRAFTEITGYAAQEVIGRTPRLLKSDHHDAAFYSAMWDSILRTGLWRGQVWNRRKDGVKFPEWLTITAVKGSLGETTHYIGTIADMTERERMEEALRRSEQRLRTIVETEPECVKVVARDGQLLEMNAAGLAMLEAASLAEAQRHTLAGFLLPEYRSAFMDLHRRVMNGESGLLAFEIEGLKGTRRWLETHATPMRDAAGKVEALLGITRDVTESKKAEVTRALLEGQLRESQKMEALGTLAGGVAHDFNNALAAIIGNVELARQDVGPAHPALVSLEEIGKASRRAKDLVQQILAFSRRQKLERRPMSLALVVVETARLVRATLPAMVSLTVNCEGDTPAVLADATQIEQILLNLCANAAHAVEDIAQPAVIEVSLSAYEHAKDTTRADLPPGRYARLTVRDNGMGMDEATRRRIFEPFFTTKPAGTGTGLGLSVVHGIVQAHEASIEVESIPGGGSTFRIYFPSAEAPAADLTAPPPDVSPVQGKGKHVLYLDDEEAIIFLMKRLLERKGYRVSGYTEPRKALAAVRADPGQFDLAVTDYYMPGMSGLEVAQALKEIRPDLPVVMASGYISEELRAKAPAAGIREVIYKPNTVEDLCEAVARFASANAATGQHGG